MLDAFFNIVLNPFLDFLVLAAMGGQFVKTQIFTTRRAVTKGQFRWFWKWGRKTLPFHPVLMGALAGLLWATTGWETPGLDSGHPSIYFAAAGVFSTWGFSILKSIFKPMGIEIDPSKLPGQTEIPDIDPPTSPEPESEPELDPKSE